jgi:hypothetical protein
MDNMELFNNQSTSPERRTSPSALSKIPSCVSSPACRPLSPANIPLPASPLGRASKSDYVYRDSLPARSTRPPGSKGQTPLRSRTPTWPRSPPARPPRPPTALPNIRPTIILSPFLVSSLPPGDQPIIPGSLKNKGSFSTTSTSTSKPTTSSYTTSSSIDQNSCYNSLTPPSPHFFAPTNWPVASETIRESLMEDVFFTPSLPARSTKRPSALLLHEDSRKRSACAPGHQRQLEHGHGKSQTHTPAHSDSQSHSGGSSIYSQANSSYPSTPPPFPPPTSPLPATPRTSPVASKTSLFYNRAPHPHQPSPHTVPDSLSNDISFSVPGSLPLITPAARPCKTSRRATTHEPTEDIDPVRPTTCAPTTPVKFDPQSQQPHSPSSSTETKPKTGTQVEQNGEPPISALPGVEPEDRPKAHRSQRTRHLWMLGTVAAVALLVAGILGGVIWRLAR